MQTIDQVLKLKRQYKGDTSVTLPININSWGYNKYVKNLNDFLQSSEILELSDRFLANKYIYDGVVFNAPTDEEDEGEDTEEKKSIHTEQEDGRDDTEEKKSIHIEQNTEKQSKNSSRFSFWK